MRLRWRLDLTGKNENQKKRRREKTTDMKKMKSGNQTNKKKEKREAPTDQKKIMDHAPDETLRDEITKLVKRWGEKGDMDAFDQAFALIYADLAKMAHFQLQKGYRANVPETLSLVNRLYLKWYGRKEALKVEDRKHLENCANKAMKHLLIDIFKKNARQVNVVDEKIPEPRIEKETKVSVCLGTRVHEAIENMASRNPREAAVAQLYLEKHTQKEIAENLGVAVRTVKRLWQTAKQLLTTRLILKEE